MKTYKETARAPIKDGGGWNVAYVINAPWAHPLWSQYLLLGYDLGDGPEVNRKLDGATHEVIMFAVDNDTKIEDSFLSDQKGKYKLLQPANICYQLVTTNDALVEILDGIVNRIEATTMSPDTDFRFQWDDIFVRELGGVTLLRSIFDKAE